MTTGDYALGLIGLAAIAISLAITARIIRRALLPEWDGAPSLLAEAILAIGAFILISELLGLFGLLEGVLLVAACLLVGGSALYLERWDKNQATNEGEPDANAEGPGGGDGPIDTKGQSVASGPSPPPGHFNWQLLFAVVIALLVVAQWAAPTLLALDRGIYGGDSLWYHLPFAAHIAQTGSVTELLFVDPLYLNWFYPQNSELLHAGGLLMFGNDFLSPLLNLAWLGLALLAGWCLGRPQRAGAATLASVAALMTADLMFSRQPGNANNDVVAIALLLASAAILVQPGRGGPRPLAPLAVAGLAAGMALGTKLTVVVPVAVLTAGVITIAPQGTRGRVAAVWGGGLLAGGGFWYLRNLVVSGNPFPWADLGPISQVEELEGRDPYSIAHYLTDSDVWGSYFTPGLEERLGDLWPLALALAVGGVIVGLTSGRRVEQMLAVVAGASALAYVLTPLSAAGPEGMPLAFRLNIRYLAPALALAYVLLAIPPQRLAPARRRQWTWGALGLFAVLILVSNVALDAIELDRLPEEAVLALAVVALPVAVALLARRGVPGIALAAVAAAAVIGLAVLGRAAQQDYLDQRYSPAAPDYPEGEHPSIELGHGLGAAYDWARDTAGLRIALSGTEGALFQYGLWGGVSSNEVRFLGRRGDRGSFNPITECPEYVAAINNGDFDFVVTTPEYDQDHPEASITPLAKVWLANPKSRAERVTGGRLVDVWRLGGQLDPAICVGFPPG